MIFHKRRFLHFLFFLGSFWVGQIVLCTAKEEDKKRRSIRTGSSSSSSSFLLRMGSGVSRQVERRKALTTEKRTLYDLHECCGEDFPACTFKPADRKNWMDDLHPEKLKINRICWPGTHDSATDRIGIPLVTRPFAQCQSLSVYHQLVLGTRVLDIRVQKDRQVCHGILVTYSIDVVIKDIKKFLSETHSEIIILEVRTEYGHDDPPEFDKYLMDHLGQFLIHQNDNVFNKTIRSVAKENNMRVEAKEFTSTQEWEPSWNSGHLKDDWINTDLPSTKFESNLKYLSEQPPVSSRKFFYRVENTVTPKPDKPIVCVRPVTGRIHEFARLFITRCFSRGIADKLQIFSTDFIEEDFVDACVAVTFARAEGKA